MVTFVNRAELEANIIRRARAVMGMRNVVRPNDVRVCVNVLSKLHGLEFSDNALADIAKEMADDTIYNDIEYFR